MSDIPAYILEQLFCPGGMRLPKRGRWQDSLPDPPVYVYGGYSTVYSDRRLPAHYSPPSRTNDFRHHEYQFWRGYRAVAGGGLWQCRACYTSIGEAAFRRVHHEGTGCADRIVKALKLLRTARVCLSCGAITSKTKWGAPLCSKKCIEDWMWIGGDIAKFDAAIKTLKAQEEEARAEA